MKKYLAALSATGLIGIAPYALAASSTDLTVAGTITPAACTPSLSGGGVVDYGRIYAKDLNERRFTRLGLKTVQLTVSCDEPTKFAVSFVDNRASSSTSINVFGLGLNNGTEKIGFYYLAFSNHVADVPSEMLITYNGGLSWKEMVEDDDAAPYSMVALGNYSGTVGWSPHNVKDAVMDMTLDAYIERADSLTLTDEVLIDGSATLQIVYL